MHLNPSHLPVPFPFYLLCPVTSPPKDKRQKTKKKKRVSLLSWSMSQRSLLFTLLYLHMFIAMSHWFGLRPLASAIQSKLDLHRTLGYPDVALCQGDPVALDLQDWLLNI